MSSDINVQTFSGKVNITSNLLVGSSHLFVDTINNRVGLVTNTPDAGLHVNSNAYVNTDFRVGSEIVMNDTTGQITAGSFVGDGSAMTGINSDSGSWVNGTNSNVHLATLTDKVGIGTSSPEAKLHLYQSAGSTNLVEKHTNASTGDYQQHINYTHYASVAGGASRDPDNSRGLWIGNMVDENDASPSGANFAAFTDSFQFYAVADRTKYDSSLSFTSNTDNLLYSGGTFNKVMRISADGNVTATTFTGALSTSVTPGSYLTGSAYNGSTARTFAVDATTTNTASKIVARDSNGDIYGRYLRGEYVNISHSTGTRNSDTIFYSSTDNYIRKTNASGMRSSLGLANSATITASASAGNSTIVQRHSSGYIYANYFNTTPNDVSSGITKVCVETGNDGFIRHGTQAGVRSFLGLGAYAYKGDSRYNIHDGWLRENGDNDFVKLYGNSRSMVFRTDGNTQYGSNGGYPFVWLYGGDGTGNRLMLLNTSGQLWCSNYGWLHDKFAYKAGSTGQNFSSNECYVQSWVRTNGNSGHYWEGSSNGSGWHIYPRNRADMFLRTGSGNGGICGTIGNTDARGYVHWTTSNEIGFLNSGRSWSLRMDNSHNCHVYGRMYASGYVYTNMTARYYNVNGHNNTHTANRPISVYAEHHMRCSELQVTSDRRIKTDIVDVDDGSALELLRKIQPKTYGYVDTMEKGTKRVYGFIAQEIKELIPEAVDVSEGDLPNIYGHATVDHEQNTITFRDFDTSNLNQTDSIIYIDQDDKRQTLKIKSVLNSTQLEIEEDLEKIVEAFQTSELEEYKFTGEIFIWGQHVDDFHHLQKSAIYTVATAALQEVDRQLQAEKARTYELQKKVELLEMSHASLIQRIEALENL